MTGEKITHITIDEIRAKRAAGEDRTDWARVDALTDEEIEAAMRDDPDWRDHMDEDWSKAELVVPTAAPVAVKVKPWLRSLSDTVRSAYDRGYNDARIAGSKLGDSKGYRGQEVSAELVKEAGGEPAPMSAEPGKWLHETLTPDEAWELLCNSDDRTSPEEYPEHALITKEELASYMVRAVCVPDLTAENARLREALAPFAAEADEHDGASAIFSAEVPISWLRAARAAHKGGAA